jgi:outer membrane protein OmpA-like peptidoglycan-associated protein
MNFAGPLVMSVLAKQIMSGGLNASSLVNMLTGQKNNIINAAPAGLSGLLGLSSLSNLGSEAYGAAKSATYQAEKAKNKWLGPLLGLLLGLLLIWLFARDCGTPKVSVPTVDSVAIRAQIDSIAAAASKAAESVKSFVTNKDLGGWIERTVGDVTLRIPEFGIEANLLGFITDASKIVDKTTWFDFDRLLFDTGSAVLRPESQEQLTNIAQILKAYPAVKVKIGGYTDNVGDAASNMKLSQDRATNVMNELVAMGVDASRLTAEGYGDQHPVADNTTEEGRALNRRISMRVTGK